MRKVLTYLLIVFLFSAKETRDMLPSCESFFSTSAYNGNKFLSSASVSAESKASTLPHSWLISDNEEDEDRYLVRKAVPADDFPVPGHTLYQPRSSLPLPHHSNEHFAYTAIDRHIFLHVIRV